MQSARWGKGLVVAAAFAICAGTVQAQEDEGGPMTQGDDAKYVSITFVKYKPSKRERAMQIIADHFAPAGAAAGTPGPLGTVHMQTGEWDVMFVWALEGGMADLEWYRSPNDVKWFEAMVEQEGSVEAAQAVIGEYVEAIADVETDVGHYHDDSGDSDE